jgi:SOS-response transcriptional repressor LexA
MAKKRITEKRVREALTAASGNVWKATRLLDIFSDYYLRNVIKERYPHLLEMVSQTKVEHLPGTHPAFLRIAPWGDHFMAQASGDCMTGAGIRNGALLEIERTCDVAEGDIIISRVGNTPLVKRLKIAEDRAIILQPENPDYAAIYITEDTDFEIFGVVRRWANWMSEAAQSKSRAAG